MSHQRPRHLSSLNERIGEHRSKRSHTDLTEGEISRRAVILGGTLATAAAWAWPASASVQIDVPQLDLNLTDQLRASTALSMLLRWDTTYQMASLYRSQHDKPPPGDEEALTRMHAYLSGSLKGLVEDIQWIATLTTKNAESFQRAALRTIEQLPILEREKTTILAAVSERDLPTRLANVRDDAPKVADGVSVMFKQSVERNRIPQIEDKTVETKWICMVLHSMLSSAIATSQWYLLATITLKMQAAGCIGK